nr:DNA modification methylase [Methylobacterium sp. W2]
MTATIPSFTPRVRIRSMAATPLVSNVAPSKTGRDGSIIAITIQPLAALSPVLRQLRRRGRGQVERLAANIARFGCVVPLLVTGTGEIIDGHGILDACRMLGRETVPTIVIDHLSAVEVRALRLSLNKLAEQSTWDPIALAAEFADLLAVDPDLIAFTGFSMPEIDLALAARDPETDDLDGMNAESISGPRVSRIGDLWHFSAGHKLLCANSRESTGYATLLGRDRVQMVFTDPPYGCAIQGHVSRSHREFVEGSGMSEDEAMTFFEGFLSPMLAYLQDGAIVDLCIDWRGMHPLVSAARRVGLVQQNLCVWDKGSGGMGSLYRHQAEYILIMKCGKAAHINNVELGRHGRNRTTVWQAPGLAQFGRVRKEALGMHPTVKPIGLVADALLDTSHPGGIVLDPFCGSGTTLLAAHRTRRLGLGIELDPAYVDVAVRRMEAATGAPARHVGTGLTFDEIAAMRVRERSDSQVPSQTEAADRACRSAVALA